MYPETAVLSTNEHLNISPPGSLAELTWAGADTEPCGQDGAAIKPSERIAAQQALPGLEKQLQAELLLEGIDPVAWADVEDDSLDIENVEENG